MLPLSVAPRRIAPVFAAVFAAVLVASLATAPVTPARSQATQRGGSSSRARAERKTLQAVVGAVNGMTAVLTPSEGGDPITASLTPKTKFFRPAARATNPGFVPGEQVVVRLEFAAGAAGPRATVVELWEPAMYEEQSRRRKEMTAGIVRQTLTPGSRDGFLLVEDAEGGSPITFRVTEKTMFRKGGVAVPPSAYPPGASAVVKPRALPSGGVMASVVAESEEAAEQAYKDTLMSCTVWPSSPISGRRARIAPSSVGVTL